MGPRGWRASQIVKRALTGGDLRPVLWLTLWATALGGCAVINRMDGISQAQELRVSGVLAEATVLKIWDTGMTVNQDPVVGFLLEVRPRDRAAYQAETKLLISRLSIPQIQPGAVVTVRYDPAKPSRVSLDLGALAARSATLPAPTPAPHAAFLEAEKQRLLATGVAGSATILQCRALGLFDAEGRPVYDLLLTVEVPGQEPVQRPARVGVPSEREHWFKVGQRLPIKADPSQPSHVALDWDRLE
jgi:hypothetical protein